MTEGFIDVPDSRLYYRIIGKGDPLVLVHAGVADSRMWDEQIGPFSETYRVISYDARGFGKSDPATTTYRPYEDLRAVLEHVGAEPARLLGMSMGADIVMNFASAYPDRAQAIILSGAGLESQDWSRLEKEWAAEEAAVDSGDYELAADINMRLWVAGVGRSLDDVEPNFREHAYQMVLPTLTPENTGESLDFERSWCETLEQIHVPLLAIVGSLDQPEMVASAKEIAARVPDARYAEIEGVAHLPNLERSDEFNRIVLDFLAGT